MALIEDDGVEIVEAERGGEAERLRPCPLFVQEVAEDFGGHHENLGGRVELDVPCQDAHGRLRELLLEVEELLIAEGLDGGGVEDTATLGQAVIDLVLPYQCFSGPGFGANEDVVLLVNSAHGILLKGVEGEREGERGRVWMGGRVERFGEVGLQEITRWS